jgi:hypothetical protein
MATIASIKQMKLQNSEKNQKIIEKVKTSPKNLYSVLCWEKNQTSPNMGSIKWFNTITDATSYREQLLNGNAPDSYQELDEVEIYILFDNVESTLLTKPQIDEILEIERGNKNRTIV